MGEREPDSAALRARRARRHKAGDHSLCSRARCSARRGVAAQEPSPRPAVPVSGSGVSGAVAEMLAADEPDQRAVLAQVALRLAGEIDAPELSAPVVRELRLVLAQLCGREPGRTDDSLDEVARKRTERRRRFAAG